MPVVPRPASNPARSAGWVSLINPFADGHHVHYGAWVAGGLTRRGMQVQLIGPEDWVSGVQALLPPEQRSTCSGHLLELHPDLQTYFGLPTPRREAVDLRFLRAAGRAARLHGSDTAHLLWLDRFIAPLLAAWPSYRGLDVQATLHNATMLAQFRPETRSGRLRASAEAVGLRQLQRQGLHVQLHSRRVTEQLSAAGQASFVPHPAVTVTTQGLDEGASRNVRSGLGLQATDRLLLAFGGTRYEKGADLAARVLPLLPDHVHLLVAGTPQSFGAQELRALAGSAAQRLHLRLEPVPEEQVNPLFLASDLVLLPYRRIFAGQSGPLNIAAALGVPVAAADAGMLAESVRNYRLGTVFESENLTAMAWAIQEALSLRRTGPPSEFIRDHSLDAFQAAVLAAYRERTRASVPMASTSDWKC